MSAYLIAQITIHDHETYKRYLDGADAILARHTGEVVVVDDSPTILEGKWPYTRTVVIRFRNEDDAKRWHPRMPQGSYDHPGLDTAQLRRRSSQLQLRGRRDARRAETGRTIARRHLDGYRCAVQCLNKALCSTLGKTNPNGRGGGSG